MPKVTENTNKDEPSNFAKAKLTEAKLTEAKPADAKPADHDVHVEVNATDKNANDTVPKCEDAAAGATQLDGGATGLPIDPTSKAKESSGEKENKARDIRQRLNNPVQVDRPNPRNHLDAFALLFGRPPIIEGRLVVAAEKFKQTDTTNGAGDTFLHPISYEDEEDVDPTGVDEKDIELVIAQTFTTRARAIRALKNNNNDIINSIMELTKL